METISISGFIFDDGDDADDNNNDDEDDKGDEDDEDDDIVVAKVHVNSSHSCLSLGLGLGLVHVNSWHSCLTLESVVLVVAVMLDEEGMKRSACMASCCWLMSLLHISEQYTALLSLHARHL